MANKREYLFTDLSEPDALVLIINGIVYEVIQFSSSWALNEIPVAVCMLAIGRDAHSLQPAAVHRNPQRFQMETAEVVFHPVGEFNLGADWPNIGVTIFKGFFTGFTYRKINGKIHAIANLIHWLAALGMSSTLTKVGSVSNPTAMNAAAVLNSVVTGFAAPVYLNGHVPDALFSANFDRDVWSCIKELLCYFANVDAKPIAVGQCGGSGTNLGNNSRALEALNRIEGGFTRCPVPYTRGVPLVMNTLGLSTVGQAISRAIGEETVQSWSSMTFWDKLVSDFCPMFGLAVVPMVNSAIIIADTPALYVQDTNLWKEIDIDEQDSFDMSAELFRPLRGIGIITDYASETGAGEGRADGIKVGGCWTEKSVSEADGVLQFIKPPMWLENLKYLSLHSRSTTGEVQQVPIKVVGSNTNPPNAVVIDYNRANEFYKRYAHDYYVKQMLRGRIGSVSGKLRFDIAPGSIIKINPSMDVHIGGEDSLAYPIYACVSRVSITINSESTLASTTFMLSHVRTGDENNPLKTRTTVTEHPLFGSSIHGNGSHGAPLVDEYLLD